MTITREQVEARMEAMLKKRAELRENLAALDGALQDCEFWLAVLAARPPEEDRPAAPPEQDEEAK